MNIVPSFTMNLKIAIVLFIPRSAVASQFDNSQPASRIQRRLEVTSHPSTSLSPSVSSSPSEVPSAHPSSVPSSIPSVSPSDAPSESVSPTSKPSGTPSMTPQPSSKPSVSTKPTSQPSILPTLEPSNSPSRRPSSKPSVSAEPTSKPSASPTNEPSNAPSKQPSDKPSVSTRPTHQPSVLPSPQPSHDPSSKPSHKPSVSMKPTYWPSVVRSPHPSNETSENPSVKPSISASSKPSDQPSLRPTLSPSKHKTLNPSKLPSAKPSLSPSARPSLSPTLNPSVQMTSSPSNVPTVTNCDALRIAQGNSGNFLVEGKYRNCDWANVYRNSRCRNYSQVRQNCPLTCSDACITNSPSQQPSEYLDPIDVEATIQVKIGPVPESVMDPENISFFQKIVGEHLQDHFNAQSKPKVDMTNVIIVRQFIEKRSRRLSTIRSTSFDLFVDLKATATFKPWDNISDERAFAFGERLIKIFDDDIFIDNLTTEIQNKEDGDYFSNVIGFEVNTLDDIGGVKTEKDSTSLTKMSIIIISASVGAAVITLFAIGFFLVQRRKRYVYTSPFFYRKYISMTLKLMIAKHFKRIRLQNVSEEVEYLDEDIFGSNLEQADDDWENMQPERPFHGGRKYTEQQKKTSNPFDTLSTQDDGTEGGKTYSTLEKIYSDENGCDEGSYVYSLESAVASKRAPSMISGKSDEKSAPLAINLYALASQRMKFDNDVELDLYSPSSTYSGLTHETGSLIGANIMTPRNGLYSDGNDDDKTTSSDKIMIRECIAPPGKLGVVIDTTRDGPIVHIVKEGSPLENQVFPGDRIIAIDGVDTTSMSASNVTKVMARKIDQVRKIKVASKIFSGSY